MKILIVEDDEMLRMMLQSVLESEGYEVLIASDGEKALKKLNDGKVCVMITDIIMPFKEGVETIIECRKRWKDIKIIAMSGGGRAGVGDFLEMAKKFGADCVLKKPFQPDELISAVRQITS